MTDKPRIPLDFTRRDEGEMRARSAALLEEMRGRRSVRDFASEPVPTDVLEHCIATAAQAPSGANKQPWTFVLVTEPALKRRIREAAEDEEQAFYGGRASATWLDDLKPLGTDADKPFLEEAPALIVVFAQRSGPEEEQHYYVSESVGLATGILIAALHHAGLCTLTHTPSPMKFLGEILERPDTERPFLLLPVGYPKADASVPDITRKPLSEVLIRDLGR